jgi:hypothetical protein
MIFWNDWRVFTVVETDRSSIQCEFHKDVLDRRSVGDLVGVWQFKLVNYEELYWRTGDQFRFQLMRADGQFQFSSYKLVISSISKSHELMDSSNSVHVIRWSVPAPTHMSWRSVPVQVIWTDHQFQFNSCKLVISFSSNSYKLFNSSNCNSLELVIRSFQMNLNWCISFHSRNWYGTVTPLRSSMFCQKNRAKLLLMRNSNRPSLFHKGREIRTIITNSHQSLICGISYPKFFNCKFNIFFARSQNWIS